ncbi:MAG: hypothetical protein IPM46_12855 [Flavobacteriales bacterium]|nr:hypothetical protein [Flavobacteriales bacterium]
MHDHREHELCLGEPSKLCGPEDAYSYLWSTGETTECIDVTRPATYSLPVTNDERCESICRITVTTTPPPVCTIIGARACLASRATLRPGGRLQLPVEHGRDHRVHRRDGRGDLHPDGDQ